MSDALRALAQAAGLDVEWQDFRGRRQDVAPATLAAILGTLGLEAATDAQATASLERLRHESNVELPPLVVTRAGARLGLPAPAQTADTVRLVIEDGTTRDVPVTGGRIAIPADLAPGYHRLEVGRREMTLAVAPPRACGLDHLGPASPCWGIALQLYALRRTGDGGAGDYTALAEAATAAGRAGADALGISPVHALFDADPSHYSPYAPSNRLLLNTALIDPAGLAGDTARREAVVALGLGEALAQLEAAPLVDWRGVARARSQLLRAGFERWRRQPDASLSTELREFRAAGGEPLESHARFEALHAVQLRHGGAWHWRDWPAGLRNPRNSEVQRLARLLAADVDYHVFLQWLAARGLAHAQRAARDAGMRIGLINDLAVGTHDGGSHAWSHREDLLVGLSVGAPPDELNGNGQSWGLTTFSPRALQRRGYQPFIDMLRATLRHAGGLRIDHVLGLNRLWLVPQGATPTEGAYLRYPLDDLLALVALESQRHRALVIGEDLGTVPPGFRDRMQDAGLLGLRVLWFERDHGLYVDPSRWSPTAIATTSTHDVATVRGWWSERDLEWQLRLGLATGAPDELRSRRRAERHALWAAFAHARVAEGPVPGPDDSRPAVDAAIRHVARAASQLAMVPVEDLAAQDEQPNLPGTIDQHPNWRRRYPEAVPDLLAQPDVAARVEALRRARPR